ncbi:MAG: ribosome assembly factor SBDS [Acidilobus sp.]
MPRKQEYVIAWIELKGQRFEILVKPDEAFKFKEGEKVPISDILWSDTVYKDVRKGLKASPDALKKAFGTEDINVIAERILREGQIQLTEEERKKIIEMKRRQIINYIARNAVDPKTGAPIPESRIESLFEQLRIGVDPFKPVEAQALEAIKRIASVIPIKIARALLEVTIPAMYAGRAIGEIKRLGDVKKTAWLDDGSLKVELEIPAGMQLEVIDKIQSLSRGQAHVNVRVTSA